MTDPSGLPPRRALGTATAERIRTRVLTATEPAPARRRWLPPTAAAAAVVALVAGAVAVTDRRDTTSPTSPAATSPAAILPTLTDVRERCGVGAGFRYVTRYEGDDAVTWLFADNAARETVVCSWRVGSGGRMLSYVNDWYQGGMAPSRDGRVHVTTDAMMPVVPLGETPAPGYAEQERDRVVAVGTVPPEVTKVVVDGPDGRQVAALASHWFLYHLRGPAIHRLTAYDAGGNPVGDPREFGALLVPDRKIPGRPSETTGR